MWWWMLNVMVNVMMNAIYVMMTRLSKRCHCAGGPPARGASGFTSGGAAPRVAQPTKLHAADKNKPKINNEREPRLRQIMWQANTRGKLWDCSTGTAGWPPQPRLLEELPLCSATIAYIFVWVTLVVSHDDLFSRSHTPLFEELLTALFNLCLWAVNATVGVQCWFFGPLILGMATGGYNLVRQRRLRIVRRVCSRPWIGVCL